MKYFFDYLVLLTILILWSSSSTLVSIFTKGTTPVLVASVVVFISFIVLSVSMIKKENRILLRKFEFSECVKLIIPAFFGLFLYPVLYFNGISGTSPIKANILNYLWPLFAVLIDWIASKEPLNRREKISFILAFIGAYIVMFFNEDHIIQVNPLENGFEFVAFLGALSYGIYTAIIKYNLPRIKDNSPYYNRIFDDKNYMPDFLRMFLMVSVAAICHFFVIVYFFFFDINSIKQTINIVVNLNERSIALLAYSILNFTLAHFLWNKLNKKHITSFASRAAYYLPCLSTIIISKYYQVPIGISATIGLMFILASTILSHTEHIDSINATVSGTVMFIIFSAIVPIVDNEGLISTARFFLEILISLFAIYYGFVLNRVVKNYREFENILDLLHLEKNKMAPEMIKQLKTLEKQLLKSVRINMLQVYEDLSSHIDDYFSEGMEGSELIGKYYQLYRTCGPVLSISEWVIIIMLSALIVLLCFIVRENNIISNIIIIVIGSTISLCVSVLYEYESKKKKMLHRFVNDNIEHL